MNQLNKLPKSPIVKAELKPTARGCTAHKEIRTFHMDGTVFDWNEPCGKNHREYWSVCQVFPHGYSDWTRVSVQNAPQHIPEEVWDCLAGNFEEV